MFELSYESFFVYNARMLANHYRMDFLRKHRSRIAMVTASILLAILTLTLVSWPWVSGLATGAAAVGIANLVAAHLSIQRAIAYYFEKAISIHVHDAGLALRLPDFTSQWTWSGIASLASHPDYLVFMRQGSEQPVLIPATALSPDVIAFILEKVRSSGGTLVKH